MTTKRKIVLFSVLMVVCMLLSACGGSGPYSLHETKEYGQSTQRYIPENVLPPGQYLMKLPAGDPTMWVVHGSGCIAFALDAAGLPTGSIATTAGSKYPPDKTFSISCPSDGDFIWFERTLPLPAPTTAPAPTK